MADRHLDRRQVLRALLLGGAGLAVPAACGLPTGGHAIIDGPAKTTQTGSGDNPPKAPTPDDATSPENLVINFFGAAAGRNSDDLGSANDRALKFLTPTGRQGWPQQGNGITVVSLFGTPRHTTGPAFNTTYVDVDVKPTGSLGADGTVVPATQNDTSRRTLRFIVVQGSDPKRPGGYLIDQIQTLNNAPQLTGMMLASTRLDDELYAPQLIYFWSPDRGGLVPDLRYVARAGVGRELQFTDVVNWILHGPSDFLKDAVQANPYSGNTLALPNLAAPDSDGLVVNLSLPTPQSLGGEKVMAQLRWSLRPLYEGTVRLQVAGAQAPNADGSSASTGFRHWNLADQERERDDTKYCIAGGMVRPLDDPTNIPAILNDSINNGVVLAALRPDLRAAALVKNDGHLHVGGAAQGPANLTAAAVPGQPPLSGPLESWTRPVYLPSNNNRVLVGVNGLLYLVGTDGQAVQLQTPTSLPAVSAFALAPDGRRIAVISGGVPFVYSLKVNGDEISFGGSPRQIDAEVTACTGIAWIRLDKVVIAGRRGPGTYQIVESTIDGAIQRDFGSQFATEIRSIVALPPIAWNSTGGSQVALVQTARSGDNGLQVFAGSASNSPIGFTSIATPSPSPSATGAAQGPVLGTPTYPFYLG